MEEEGVIHGAFDLFFWLIGMIVKQLVLSESKKDKSETAEIL